MGDAVVGLPRSVAKRIQEEARRLGVTPEEYLLELVTQGMDPRERALEYIETAEELLRQAGEELQKGDVRQAAEKLWGAAALAVKAYAFWRDGRRLSSHGELWEYKRRLEDELGEWVSDAWNAGNTMHICFYEGWCAARDVENAMKRMLRLVEEVKNMVKKK